MSLDRLAARLYNTPLLLAPEKAEAIERVLRAHIEGTVASLPPFVKTERPSTLATEFTPMRAGYLRSGEGIALISVVGSLVQRSSYLDAESGIDSYEAIGARFAAALADPQVRGILLEVDSFGGEAAGITTLSDQIRAGLTHKPVIAHANEIAFSAGYWLASAADELYVPKTGMVGSIGVIMLHVDQSRANEKRGLDVTHIHAGARKADFSPHAPLSAEALRNGQAMVDRLYEHFIAHVASVRGISADSVRRTEAGLLHANEAEAINLVDGTASLDQALQRLGDLIYDPKQRKQHGSVAMSAQPFLNRSNEEQIMSDVKAATTQPAATTYTQEQIDAARAEGIAEGKKLATPEVIARIDAIEGHDEAKGREKLATHLARKTNTAVEDALALLALAPKETAATVAAPNVLAAKMATEAPNPKIGTAASDDGEDSEEAIGKRMASYVSRDKLKAVK